MCFNFHTFRSSVYEGLREVTSGAFEILIFTDPATRKSGVALSAVSLSLSLSLSSSQVLVSGCSVVAATVNDIWTFGRPEGGRVDL